MYRIKDKKITYTPRQTTEYEKLVRASYTAVLKMFFDKNIPLEISIIAPFFYSTRQVAAAKSRQNSLKEKSKTSHAKGLITDNSLKYSKNTDFANCHTYRWTTKKTDLDNII